MTEKRLHYYYLLIAGLWLGFYGCSSVKENKAELPTKVFHEPHILFVTLNIENSTEGTHVEVLQESLVKGMMKKAHLDQTELQNGDWKATIVYSDNDILEWTKLETPLVYRAEYVNDAGVLETKTVQREEGDVSIRLPIEGEAVRLIVEKIFDDKKELLLEIELNSL